MANDSTKTSDVPRGLAPNSTGRVPGPLGGRTLGGRLPGTLARGPAPKKPVAAWKFTPTAPIVFLEASLSPKEQAIIFAALQALTDDQLRLNGLEVYSDGSGKVASKLTTGQTLLRGLQSPLPKVIITLNAAMTASPFTHWDGHYVDINVDLYLQNGDIGSFNFFTLTGATVPVPGGGIDADSVVKPPGYIVLAHELTHAYYLLRFRHLQGSKDYLFGDPAGNKFKENAYVDEMAIIGIEGTELITENRMRLEHGIGIRVSHATTDLSFTSQGVTPVSAQPSWWPNYPHP